MLWLNWISFDFLWMWYILLLMFLIDILLFDDYILFSWLWWYSCLYKYISLFWNLVRFLLILMFFVLLWECSFFRFFRILNFVLIDFSFVIICWGLFCGFLIWWEFIMLFGESLILVLVVILIILVFVFLVEDLGMFEIWIRGFFLYCFSLFNCILSCLFLLCSLLIWIYNGLIFLVIICDIFFWRDFFMIIFIVFVIFWIFLVDIVMGELNIYWWWKFCWLGFVVGCVFCLVVVLGVDCIIGLEGDLIDILIFVGVLLCFCDFLGVWGFLMNDMDRFFNVFLLLELYII